MPELRHTVVALDENGTTIQHMDLRPNPQLRRIPYRQRLFWTTDWEKAKELSGRLTTQLEGGDVFLHPNNRRNLPTVRVAGYEVVSETIGADG